MLKTIVKLSKAFLHSSSGLKFAWRTQWAFRFEVFILIIAVPLALLLADTPVEIILLISSVVILPMMELINSAIETTINRIGLEYHELSGLAKDTASAALLVALINAVMTWGVILITKLL